MIDYTVVIPTVGRESLADLVRALDSGEPGPREIVVVNDRPGGAPRLPECRTPLRRVESGGNGPAAARNRGWRLARSPWVVFVDDDVTPGPGWHRRLAEDLGRAGAGDAASQARITVPLPDDRRPTDAERNTAALGSARWITADMAYRRDVLERAGGFDERFRRAFREDADLALRVTDAGHRIRQGDRESVHALPESTALSSVRAQAGNADDALMRRKHGPRWREAIGEAPSSLGRYALITAAGAGAAASLLFGHRSASAVLASVWAALTADFAAGRLRPGPRTPSEVVRMALSSALIPPAACGHRIAGWARHRADRRGLPAAVLFDRDGTLIEDVLYLRDPARVRPRPAALAALRTVRRAGLPVGVVTNQPGVARGELAFEDLSAVHAEIDRRFGAFDTWQVCPHDPDDGCGCRKPAPGLVKLAAAELGVDAARCVVIGDTGADVAAARAAGARAILVPTRHTRPAEVRHARDTAAVASDLGRAVGLALGGPR